jgi:predicted DNA-binding transcriptional regulator YafY
VGPAKRTSRDGADLGVVRAAIRGGRKLRITYEDGGGARSDRTVWPFLVGYFDGARLVSAWCELRHGFRHFRADRIVRIADTGEHYPTPRGELERQWRELEGR